jgi:hypothetical protein
MASPDLSTTAPHDLSLPAAPPDLLTPEAPVFVPWTGNFPPWVEPVNMFFDHGTLVLSAFRASVRNVLFLLGCRHAFASGLSRFQVRRHLLRHQEDAGA